MLSALKQFLSEFTDGDNDDARFDENDYRLAAAALLVHTARIDGAMTAAERDRLKSVFMQRFSLDAAAADELLREATEVESDAVDLYRFTSRLNRALDEDGRRRIVEMMWQVIFTDGQVSEFEDNLVWRAADLLHVPRQTRIGLRQKVAQTASAAGTTD
jgi:uncharacterized tellurite resistance protein B-like protein